MRTTKSVTAIFVATTVTAFVSGCVTKQATRLALTSGGIYEGCAPDAVRVGSICMDKFEASVWKISDSAVIQQVRSGTATVADLQSGGVQLGLAAADYPCGVDGNGCPGQIYAVSV